MSFYFEVFNPLVQWKKGDYPLSPQVAIRLATYRTESVPIPEFDPDNPLMSSAAELAQSIVRESWLSRDEDKQSSVSMHNHPHRILLEAMYLHLVGVARAEIEEMLTGFGSIQADEVGRHKEYRTQRLVLAAWDKLETGELP